MLKWIMAHKIACIITASALVVGGTTGGVVYYSYQGEQQEQEEARKSLEAIQRQKDSNIQGYNDEITALLIGDLDQNTNLDDMNNHINSLNDLKNRINNDVLLSDDEKNLLIANIDGNINNINTRIIALNNENEQIITASTDIKPNNSSNSGNSSNKSNNSNNSSNNGNSSNKSNNNSSNNDADGGWKSLENGYIDEDGNFNSNVPPQSYYENFENRREFMYSIAYNYLISHYDENSIEKWQYGYSSSAPANTVVLDIFFKDGTRISEFVYY